jgi:hypothetical protein
VDIKVDNQGTFQGNTKGEERRKRQRAITADEKHTTPLPPNGTWETKSKSQG